MKVIECPSDEKHPDESHIPASQPDPPPAYPLSSPPAPSTHYSNDYKTSIPLPQHLSYARLPLDLSGFGGPSTRPASNYAAVSLAWDRIRIIGFPKDVVEPIDAAIKRTWTAGVKDSKKVDEVSCYWKLSGWPWPNIGSGTIRARRMMAHILHALAGEGWHLAVSADISRPGSVRDTLIFRQGTPARKYIFSISLHSWDKIRIVDAPTDGVRVAFELAVRGAWPAGIQDAKEEEPGAWQLKLKGTPWTTLSGDQFNQARFIMIAVLTAMEMQGYNLLGRVAMTSGSEDTTGLDTWFFVQS